MGNQGMTNWKFTAFFAISLMLTAGLFTNAAIAGNGDGKVICKLESNRSAGLIMKLVTPSSGLLPTLLPINDGTNGRGAVDVAIIRDKLHFLPAALRIRWNLSTTQTAADMRNGAVRITTPDGVDGWKIDKKLIKVSEGADGSLYCISPYADGEQTMTLMVKVLKKIDDRV